MIIDKNKFELTVITPTIGKKSLDSLISSIQKQTIADKIFHLILWDEVRDTNAKEPESYNAPNRWNLVLPWGLGRNEDAPGSSLRAVGMISAFTPYVTFADDDVTWDAEHAQTMLKAIAGLNWASCYRKIYTSECEYLGIDQFESVGDETSRKVPYEMLDGNCMIFKREFGCFAAQFYRETKVRNDDRLLYGFLKEYAGKRGNSLNASINHTCPDFLIDFFRQGCTK